MLAVKIIAFMLNVVLLFAWDWNTENSPDSLNNNASVVNKLLKKKLALA